VIVAIVRPPLRCLIRDTRLPQHCSTERSARRGANAMPGNGRWRPDNGGSARVLPELPLSLSVTPSADSDWPAQCRAAGRGRMASGSMSPLKATAAAMAGSHLAWHALHAARSGRSVSEGGRCSGASPGPPIGQESRSAHGVTGPSLSMEGRHDTEPLSIKKGSSRMPAKNATTESGGFSAEERQEGRRPAGGPRR